jgi:hypothetical protein
MPEMDAVLALKLHAGNKKPLRENNVSGNFYTHVFSGIFFNTGTIAKPGG